MNDWREMQAAYESDRELVRINPDTNVLQFIVNHRPELLVLTMTLKSKLIVLDPCMHA